MKTLRQFLEEQHTQQTVESYLHSINHFIKMHPKAEAYTYHDLSEYRRSLVEEYSTAYAQKIFASIKRYYDHLQATGQRKDHPCKQMLIKGGNRHIQLQDLFSSEELYSLLDREERYEDLRFKNRVAISLLVYQGLAARELVRLDVEDIDLDNATVYIKASKNLHRRILELHRTQVHLLSAYIHHHRPKLLKKATDRLLIGKLGKPQTIDATNRMVKTMQPLFPNRVINPKIIRQSVIANWLNEKRYPLEQVQRMAGHRWPSTTEKYLRKDPEERRKMVNMWHPLKK